MDETLVWYSGAGIASTDRHWLHTDEQGSVIASSDDAGAGTIYVYSPTGEPQGGFSAGGAIFRYTGQAQLAALGLYYYKARIYDPQMGRFLQADPAGYSAGMNLYAYVMNNYPNASDPSGMDGDDCPPYVGGVLNTCSSAPRIPSDLRGNPCGFNYCMVICDSGTGFCTPASIPDQGFVRDRPAPQDQKPRPQSEDGPQHARYGILKCGGEALGKNALALGSDLVGLFVPGEKLSGIAIQLGASFVGMTASGFRGDKTGAFLGLASWYTVALAPASKELGTGLLSLVPGVGTAVAAYTSYRDYRQLLEDYAACKATLN